MKYFVNTLVGGFFSALYVGPLVGACEAKMACDSRSSRLRLPSWRSAVHCFILTGRVSTFVLVVTLGQRSHAEVSTAPCQLHVEALRCENLGEPLAIATPRPRLSWKLSAVDSARVGVKQTAFQIQVATSAAALQSGDADLWDSGKVPSKQTAAIFYEGRKLGSGQRCYWSVRAWDSAGAPSAWSAPATFRAGLSSDDWHGPWIGADGDGILDAANQYYRTTVTVPEGEEQLDAIVYVASLGYHELYVNGLRVGDQVVAPAISDPLHRVRYVAYDVSALLRRGVNAMGVAMGAGWTLYEGHGWSADAIERWPKRPALRLQCILRNANGQRVSELHADETWNTHASEIQPLRRWQFRDFNGERIVEASPLEGWSTVDFDASSWRRAVARPMPAGVQLVPQEVEPNRVLRSLIAAQIEQIDDGSYHATFDKMFTGLVEVDVQGRPGTPVRIEVSDRRDQPSVYGQQDEFMLDAGGRGRFSNRFNYANGQWLTIRGDIDPPKLENVRVLHVGTDLRRTARFCCSDELHNQIYETALHTFECLNLGGYVVDCAHRERLGYGGDGQSTAMLALANYECSAFYEKWLRDWCDMQQPDGNLPFSAPTYGGGGGPAWSGFIVHVAWDLYQRQGDPSVLRMVLPSVRAWLTFLRERSSADLLERYDGPPDVVQHEWSFLGDWVDPGHDQTPNNGAAETLFLNNCYYVWTLRRAASMAEVVGEHADAEQWRRQAAASSGAIHAKYWNAAEKRYTFDSQACVAIAILAEVAPATSQPLLERRLEQSIVDDHNGHLDTGIGGTVFLLRALQKINRPDLVALMAGRRDNPSWGHMLDQGATAFWEQWDGVNSRCHSSYLAIGGWYVESIAGIQVRSTTHGYDRFEIRPGVVPTMTWAEGELDSSHGLVKSAWRQVGEGYDFDVTIPPNALADFYIPADLHGEITVNGLAAVVAPGVLSARQSSFQTILELDSGRFRIHVAH
jgi:alpha-L-rhamnosidase